MAKITIIWAEVFMPARLFKEKFMSINPALAELRTSLGILCINFVWLI
jgi:hypothetical protein